jgi:hypothetical protein
MGIVREIGKSGKFLYIHDMDIPPDERYDPPRFLGGYEVRLKKGVPYEVPILEEVEIYKVTNALGRVESRQTSRIVHAEEFINWMLSTEPYADCGVIVLQGSTPTPEEKEISRRATIRYWFREVERFNDTARRYPAVPPPLLQRWAERLGLQLEQTVSEVERMECPACMQPVPRGALVCPRCTTRLYPDDVFQRLLQERQQQFARSVKGEGEAVEEETVPDSVIDDILRQFAPVTQ